MFCIRPKWIHYLSRPAGTAGVRFSAPMPCFALNLLPHHPAWYCSSTGLRMNGSQQGPLITLLYTVKFSWVTECFAGQQTLTRTISFWSLFHLCRVMLVHLFCAKRMDSTIWLAWWHWGSSAVINRNQLSLLDCLASSPGLRRLRTMKD